MVCIRYDVSILVLLTLLLSACQSVTAPPPTIVAEPPTAAVAPPTATELPPTATVAPTPVADAPTAPPPDAKPVMTVNADQITSQALAGNLFGDPATRPFYVLLPPSYDTGDKRYPVVYVLHPYWGSELEMVGQFKTAMEKLLRDGAVQEMIFVFPNGDNRLHGSMYLSSPTIGDYETYLTQELVDLVDSKYRALPQRESRGVTGCSMGGDGAIHLALKYPQVYSAVAPVAATYDAAQDPALAQAAEFFQGEPADLDAAARLDWPIQSWMALAAAAASNLDKPPFFLDMPFTLVDGQGQVVQEVVDRIVSADATHDLERYINQPERLRAIMLYHGAWDTFVPEELAQAFSARLTEQGIEHAYVEVNALHCSQWAPDLYTPVVQFMSDNLVAEELAP